MKVTYDPKKITYRQLLYYFIKHIDPTDGEGSFKDRGVQYSPAIYYDTPAQKTAAQAMLADIAARDVFKEDLEVPVLKRQPFYPAEKYHQNFAQENPLRYKPYRFYSGRDRFYERYWGNEQDSIPTRLEKNKPNSTSTDSSASPSSDLNGESASASEPWTDYQKPSRSVLKEKLSGTEYRVTQKDGTEIPFRNELWDEKRDRIYIDILSGEPLFSSEDKYRSGTGWPSFTKPLEAANLETKEGNLLGYQRIEARSRYGDNHLGHIFNDGPTTLEASGGAPATGLRWCLNSAALKFISKSDLEADGYGQYLGHFETAE